MPWSPVMAVPWDRKLQREVACEITLPHYYLPSYNVRAVEEHRGQSPEVWTTSARVDVERKLYK